MLAYRAALMFAERDQPQPFSGPAGGIRALGLVLVMASGTAIAALNLGAAPALPQGAGASSAGHRRGDGRPSAPSAARLILLAVFLFGMTIFTDLSWLRLMDRLGALAIDGAGPAARSGARALIDRLRDRRAREKQLEARKQVIDEHVEKKQAQAAQDQAPQATAGEV
jgi:S-DNA-T family DNA segregation ATPase FtsK/SpoIIIE